MVTFHLSMRWLWLCMGSVRILYARSQLHANSVETFLSSSYVMCHCAKENDSWTSRAVMCCLVTVQLEQLILLVVSSCLLHYIDIMSLSWVVKWAEENDWAEKRSIKREWHWKKVVFVEINIFSKHSIRLNPSMFCSCSTVYLVTSTVPVTVIAKIFTIYRCENNVFDPVLQMRNWGRETWRTCLEKWEICGQEEAKFGLPTVQVNVLVTESSSFSLVTGE